MSRYRYEDDPLGLAEQHAPGEPSGTGNSFLDILTNPLPFNMSKLAGTSPGAGFGGVPTGGAASHAAAPVTSAAAAPTAAAGKSMTSPGLGMLLSSLIGFGGSALNASAQQKMKSFSGTAVDPIKMLTQAFNNANGMGQALTKKARQGVTMRTTMPSLPGFAEDPAIKDPSLLHYDGLDLPEGMFNEQPNTAVPRNPANPVPTVRRRAQ